jgi:hypothetical protein
MGALLRPDLHANLVGDGRRYIGLHVHWSLGPHGAADDESPAANRGAAELVFTPFARDRR